MQQTEETPDCLMQKPMVTTKVAMTRMVIGLLQGLILYALYRTAKSDEWPATEHYLFTPLLLVSMFVPIILISSLGHLEKRRAGIWVLAAAIIVGALAIYDVWRDGADGSFRLFGNDNAAHARFPSLLVFVFNAAGLYIAHTLILASAADQRRIARYSTYFEKAWNLIIQIKFSTLFVGVLWLVLWLGSALFMLVKLDFLAKVLQQSWFVIPVTAFAFACAMHITDVRPAIVQGTRTLLLILMSWTLPIANVLVASFLCSLLWTGLQPLWATRHATSVLLGTCALLIFLINAAFQNGEVASAIVRVGTRVAALLLLPIVTITIYALGLRVNQYGWTSDRVIAASCLLLAVCYTVGYVWAACRKEEGWLATVTSTNVATAFVVLAVLLALFSPIADPARLSVSNQMKRFVTGKITAEKFDYDYLKFEGVRYGLAALEQLKIRLQGKDAALIREKASLALNKKSRSEREVSPLPVDLTANITMWPKTASLPDSFLHAKWVDSQRAWELPSCVTHARSTCDAYLIDFTGDGKAKVLLIGTSYLGTAIMKEDGAGYWKKIGTLPDDLASCEPLREKLRSGAFQLIAPRIKDLEIGGQRIVVQNVEINAAVNCAALRK